MNDAEENFKNNITAVFGICVDVLNVSRSLKTISQDLKLLALNGIVQAAKNWKQPRGNLLITLSGFLSTLPTQIAPELEELVNIAGKLSREVTLCSIAVRKMMNYIETIQRIINYISKSSNNINIVSKINVSSMSFLTNIEKSDLVKYSDQLMGDNLKNIVKKGS